jgi:aspartyl protease family protein
MTTKPGLPCGNAYSGRWRAGCVGLLLALTVLTPAGATDVALTGLYGGKALVVIDGRLQSIPIGIRTPEGVKLLSIDGVTAEFEIDGQRQRLTVGGQAVSAGRDDESGKKTTLIADTNGHFFAAGTINGAPIHFLVDTGATLVSIGKADAIRAKVDYQKGDPGMVMTANGPVRIWRVTLNSVRVGEVILNQVEASVLEGDLPIALLGMSFLNRMEMKRDGASMILKKRY